MTITWANAGTILAIIAFVSGASTAYLRLMMAKEMAEMKETLMSAIKEEYTPAQLLDWRFKDIDEKQKELEKRLERLESR